jgi:heme oxygenase
MNHPIPNSVAPFIARLRESTQKAHRSVEKQVPLMSKQLNLTGYIHYLNRVLGYHHALEQTLEQRHPGLLQQLQIALRTPLLIQDLNDLHIGTDPWPAAPDSLPDMSTLAQAAGVLYVFEGSSLGGQVISAHLQKKLSLNGQGTGYLLPYGDNPYPHWREFQNFLQMTASTPSHEDEIITSAIDTFTHFEQWLQQNIR